MAVVAALAAAVVLATLVLSAVVEIAHRRYERLWSRAAGAAFAVGAVAYCAGVTQGDDGRERRWFPLGAVDDSGGELVEAWVNPVVAGCLLAGVALGVVAVRRRQPGTASEMSASDAP